MTTDVNKLTIQTFVDGVGETIRSHFSAETTSKPRHSALQLTSNVGYSDVYSNIYTEASTAQTPGGYVLITPESRINVSASTTELGIPITGPTVLATPSSVLYLSSTGSTMVDVSVLAF